MSFNYNLTTFSSPSKIPAETPYYISHPGQVPYNDWYQAAYSSQLHNQDYENNMQLLIILCLVGSSLAWYGIGRTQSVAVQGRLICNGQPAANVKVKLYEKEATFDVKMDEGVTNQNGEFRLSGHKTEISTIDPKVNVYHKCNYNGMCYRKFGITIPDNFVSRGKNPQKTFDIGTINLANRFTGETTDCIN